MSTVTRVLPGRDWSLYVIMSSSYIIHTVGRQTRSRWPPFALVDHERRALPELEWYVVVKVAARRRGQCFRRERHVGDNKQI